ncbi:LysR substrate-binding domain-containing protein [Phyllobacterium endophyticum]|uniref:LysR family transcriptional regulator n=1 Tax=Phyllobacterium endophyticum TaxID=1149773 RepID=A0A2P7ANH7_9HYPH|nr:LysR substrate-binding domain-containing protein [Phyllobacterium endophyticum]MBB3233927.1 DNA-binding transcriptional LysR family regulator [Phyllobacterium endophyticum]PSH55767.1 LysR family transcriptional regulator [Phyllobacterium endophyticum]TYR43711.1 LysR family transcriptional regulator [Phyllobacterium endophyticum]
MQRITFDLDCLRTFSTGMELGSFSKAAVRLGRSTSAVSAQLKKLEQQAGTPIFVKSGRGLALTEAGETMLAYARRLLDLNDEAVTAIQGSELEGWVRLGLQEDFGETVLPKVLGQFARAHPKVRIEARVARNAELIERITSGRLDLALAWSDGSVTTPHHERVMDVPMCWVGPAGEPRVWQATADEPLPLASLEAPCLLRTAATDALDRAHIPWRLSFVSPSLAGLWAATVAGLGVTIRTPIGLPATVQQLVPVVSGLPPLPSLGLVLHRAQAQPDPATARLATIMLQALQDVRPD